MNVTAKQKWSMLAIGSFVAGLGGLLVFGPYGTAPAVILGHIALSQIRKGMVIQNHMLIITIKGRGLAIAGLIMGYLGILIFFVLVFIYGWRTNCWRINDWSINWNTLSGKIFLGIWFLLLGGGRMKRGENKPDEKG